MKGKKDKDKKKKRAADDTTTSKREGSKIKRSASHGDKAKPNYELVLPAGAVNVLTIKLAPESWQAMQNDLSAAFTEKRANDPDYSPVWMPADIEFNGQTWRHVGVRYKGGWSLSSAWQEKRSNLPFKLDFDKFEDDYPETKNQRFFGFGTLMLGNNTADPTGLRETVVYDILTRAGLPYMAAAAYELFLDCGDGPIGLGLYTAVEAIDDTGVARFFGGDKGNIYEADGDGASLAADMFDQIPTSFHNKNKKKPDHSDLQQLHKVLHDGRRTTDPQAWRDELEAIFNVDGFLEWFGISRAVAFVDTYGFGTHNFYLYNDPKTGKLNWVSWDHNQTLQPELAEVVAFASDKIGPSWPLIRFLLDDPVYSARYRALLEENSRTALEPNGLIEQVRRRAALLAPYATRYMPAAEYDAAVAGVTEFIQKRAVSLRAFLDQK